ncbi:S-layer homology domain-containing protein [Scytonema sp. NUACC21]
MLQPKRPVVLISLAVLLTSLTACANSPTAKQLEQSLAADPRLKDNPVSFGSQAARSNQQQPTNQTTVQLPANFPKDIPLYPNASLQQVTPSGTENPNVSTRWLSIDPSNVIASYYRQQLQANNWQIVQQSNDSGDLIEARRNDLQLKVSFQPKTVTNGAPNQPQTSTEIVIEYQTNSVETAQATPTSSPETTASPVSQPTTEQFVGSVKKQESGAQTNTNVDTTNSTVTSTAREFSDLDKAPQEFQRYIQELAELGVLPVNSNAAKTNQSATIQQFEPNKNITRREYARWLTAANNIMYSTNPAKQIRFASEGSQPAFSDVPRTDPDFPVIQGLAEAGLIPSPLSGDSTAVLFRANAPLTREQMLLWKVPLDTRQALPNANLEAVKQTWGFQDVGKIDPKALRVILADFQNGEQSNIRRVFGYTTLFQPKKSVTRAEAAATLWYFGTQGDGISATEALKVKQTQQ